DAKKVSDFDVKFLPASGSAVEPAFVAHLRDARSNPPSAPLRGLRVALDPGHMGGDRWDALTGKYTIDHQGGKLAEGVLTLQTAILLEQELTALGAQVMITRRGFHPVSHLNFDTFPLHDLERIDLRESTLFAWFTRLLSAGTGSALDAAFDQS